MRKFFIYRSLVFITAVIVAFAACTKEMDMVKLEPKIATTQTEKVTSESATVTGFVVARGEGFSEKGVCYSTTPLPTVSNKKVVSTDVTPTAVFDVVLTKLAYATKYYARAYAIYAGTTIYGDELTFTTNPVIPTVTTSVFTANTGTTAKGGGVVTIDGGAAVTEYGVCYSLNQNPTIKDSKTSDGSGTGSFTSALSNLKGKTTYYVRAYATNSVGTAYGSEQTFTTPAAIVNLWVVGDFQEWSPENATDMLTNTDTDPIVKGYVYISNTNGFKFVSQKNWVGPNYGLGATAGTLSTDSNAGNLSVATPGYYLFEIDLDKLTYKATLTNWGIIGDATPGDWGASTPMIYSTTTKVFTWSGNLKVGSMKFRGTDDWAVNYGGAGVDNAPENFPNGEAKANGGNIKITTAGSYTISLDLSKQPYKYKIVAN
jgi:hypothetical protein